MYKKLRKIGLKPCVFNPKKDLKNLYYLEREFFFHNFASLFRPWFDHYFGLQKIFYRLMGAKIGKNVTFGRDIIIHDLSLIEIQDNVVLGQSCRIVGHLMSNAEEVILGKVVIGENSVVGGHVKIAPNVKIGKNCVIGLNSIILPGVELADNTRTSVLSVVRMPK